MKIEKYEVFDDCMNLLSCYQYYFVGTDSGGLNFKNEVGIELIMPSIVSTVSQKSLPFFWIALGNLSEDRPAPNNVSTLISDPQANFIRLDYVKPRREMSFNRTIFLKEALDILLTPEGLSNFEKQQE